MTNSVGNAVVHNPSCDWEGDDFHLAPRNELVIYELHVGTFNDDEDDNQPGKFASQWNANFVHPIRQAVITPQDEQRSPAAISYSVLIFSQ